MLKKLLIILGFCCFFQQMQAQTSAMTSSGFDTLSLEDLMNIKITVASIKELTPRQSPGIVNSITADDIRQMGARDLMEVLQQIPGFEFGVDVEGVVGLSVRGNWAHEGKVVLLIDGQEMNEGLYSTLQFGNHYPVENIERIEIIRGTGSALYGGYAAYAVINVMTRIPKSKSEVQASAFYGATAEDYSRYGTNVYLGRKTGNNSITFQSYAAKAQRSNKQYTDVFGNSFSMLNNSDLNNMYMNLGIVRGKLGLRAITDLYQTTTRDEYLQITPGKDPVNFNSFYLEANYEISLSNKWKIIPRLNFKQQVPWSNKVKGEDEQPSGMKIFHMRSQRYSAALNSIYDVSENLNFSTGINFFYDKAKMLEDDETFNTTGTNTLTYNNTSAFIQGLAKLRLFNVTGGLRYNINSRYNSTLVPRIGLTKEFDRLNLKVLYSRSFRAPSTQNIDLSIEIKPEVTNVLEVETGYSLNENSYITLNAYWINTNDPIIYYFDTLTNFDAYTNSSYAGTQGIEIAYRLKKTKFGLNASASFYKSTDFTGVTYNNVPGETSLHLGLAPVKANFSFYYHISKCITVSSTLNTLSSRYAITSVNESNGESVYSELPASILLNAQIDYSFKKIKGLSLQLGGYNLLDNPQWFIQPYNSNHAPLPGMGRELQLKLSYQNF